MREGGLDFCALRVVVFGFISETLFERIFNNETSLADEEGNSGFVDSASVSASTSDSFPFTIALFRETISEIGLVLFFNAFSLSLHLSLINCSRPALRRARCPRMILLMVVAALSSPSSISFIFILTLLALKEFQFQ